MMRCFQFVLKMNACSAGFRYLLRWEYYVPGVHDMVLVIASVEEYSSREDHQTAEQ